MSALPPKADICGALAHVRFVPIADIAGLIQLGNGTLAVLYVANRGYSLVLLFRCACISFFSSSGVSFGRSIVSVIRLNLPVKANGGW